MPTLPLLVAKVAPVVLDNAPVTATGAKRLIASIEETPVRVIVIALIPVELASLSARNRIAPAPGPPEPDCQAQFFRSVPSLEALKL